MLTVHTDKKNCTTGDNITISGKLTTPTINQPLLIQVIDPQGNRDRFDQVEAAADGSYSYTFRAGGLMNTDGIYSVIVSYKTTEAVTTFHFHATDVHDGWRTFTISVGDQSYPVQYRITGGSVQDMVPYTETSALTVTINTTADGTLDLRLPRNLIDSRASSDGRSGADVDYAVFVDEQNVEPDERETTSDQRTLSIDFEQGAETIEIVGTFAIPTPANRSSEVKVVQVPAGRRRRKKSSGRSSGPIHGHFFFVDIVGLSDPAKGGTESQIKKIQVLHNAIKSCSAYRARDKKYINLTGDGMVIGFLTGPKRPLELAVQLHKKLSQYNKNKPSNAKVEVRIGIDSAPILEYRDILGKRNVWGDGIVLAKRVMDRAEANDIYLTARAAEALKQFDEYRNVIQVLGEEPIKHGQSIRLYFAYGRGFGNRKRRLRPVIQESSPVQETNAVDLYLDRFREREIDHVGVWNFGNGVLDACLVFCDDVQCEWWDKKTGPRSIFSKHGANALLPANHGENPLIRIMSRHKKLRTIRFLDITQRT